MYENQINKIKIQNISIKISNFHNKYYLLKFFFISLLGIERHAAQNVFLTKRLIYFLNKKCQDRRSVTLKF